MLQNDKRSAKTSERADRKEAQQRKSRGASTPQALTLALQAVQAGVPLTHLPPAQLFALSARIGNSALLGLMAQQQAKPAFAPVVLPAGAVQAEPFAVSPPPLEPAAAPDWAALPALQTAPAAASGVGAQGGVAFAGI